MVRADNLDADCLALIFAFLYHNDLYSLSLVSRSFLTASTPFLYRTLVFHVGHVKKYHKMTSCFGTVLSHRHLAAHIRHIDIRISADRLLIECNEVISICHNLLTFTCTPKVLPRLISSLCSQASIQRIRVHANLYSPDTEKLALLKNLREITVDGSSWHVIDYFPQWAATVRETLTTLAFYHCSDLDESILESVLFLLPCLKGLHVVGCQKSTLFRFRQQSQISLIYSSFGTLLWIYRYHPNRNFVKPLSRSRSSGNHP